MCIEVVFGDIACINISFVCTYNYNNYNTDIRIMTTIFRKIESMFINWSTISLTIQHAKMQLMHIGSSCFAGALIASPMTSTLIGLYCTHIQQTFEKWES